MNTWNHKSVKLLIEETGISNPITAIKEKARLIMLNAFERGLKGPPYNPIELAQLLKLDIIPNDDIDDACTVPLSKHNLRIEYNPFQSPSRINFSIAHEIAHTLFSDCYEERRNREEKNTSNWELEFLCNIAASEILLPYASFTKEANNTDLTIEGLLEIARKYKASLESVFLRFTEVVDKSCSIIIGTFINEDSVVVDYFKPSRTFKYKVDKGYKIPGNSSVYESKASGWTSRNLETWEVFNNDELLIYSIGLPPLKRENKKRVGIFIVPIPTKGYKEIENKIALEYGDATKPRGEGVKIIAQVVNSYGALGMGFGKSLSKNYPIIKKKLDEWKSKKELFRMGNSQLIKIEDDLYVFQMLAQKGIFAKEGEIPLKYSSLRKCLIDLSVKSLELNASIHMPQIGAGQAKGDWNIIQEMLHDELVAKGLKIYIYLLPGTVYTHKLKSNLTLFKEDSTWQAEK
jgi:Zn-dependent peptidase ImmA (M78 family)